MPVFDTIQVKEITSNKLKSLGKAEIAGNLEVGTNYVLTAAGEQSLGKNDIKEIKNLYYNDFKNNFDGWSINWTDGSHQEVDIAGPPTYTFTDPTGICNLVLKVRDIGTGGTTPSWPANVKWQGGSAPTIANSETALIFFFYDGSNYWAKYQGNYS